MVRVEKVSNGELYETLANSIRVGTSRRMRGAGHVACVGIKVHTLVVRKLKETVHLESTHLD
jgi:hypothetical protein